jgi:hypothetical protein
MDFVATTDFKSPYVVSTGRPDKPTAIKVKKFKKGDIIVGEMKHANGQPAFVLWKGVVVVPLSCVKQVITKEINTTSSVEGGEVKKETSKATTTDIKLSKNPKIQYMDAILLGSALGAGAAYLAEKQGWIAEPSSKNKLIGAVIGAVIMTYGVYRFKNNK